MKFFWGQNQEEAFKVLKKKLCKAQVLAFSDGTKDFVVYSDASAKGLGCLLMQCSKVTVYASRQLKKANMRYMTYDLELAAIVFSLKI